MSPDAGLPSTAASAAEAGTRLRVVLVSPYELGRQPFALAQPAAWLRRAGFDVACLDLSLQRLDPEVLAGASLIAVSLGMHTATRIAGEALPRIRAIVPAARLCAFGLYAPGNEAWLRGLGVEAVFGGECEAELLALARRLRGETVADTPPGRVEFIVPDRSGLPPLARYAKLLMPDGSARVTGFAEASRGCKHLCRHCPVVPVYEGRFRAVPVPVVMADIRQQVAAGAQHISFGDPDFLNGPTHAQRVVRALGAEFPDITWDATIKVQHLLDHAEMLPEFAASGCLFVTTAVESVEDDILERLAKNHTAADFERAAAIARDAGIALAPTFVAFTPWTTLEGYRSLLEHLLRLRLVESVPPVQLAIRLLVPAGSRLLELPGFGDTIQPFDGRMLGYPWRHGDPRVDELHARVNAMVAGTGNATRREVFECIWRLAHESLGLGAPSLANADPGDPIAHHSEPWYCCAEPTDQQLEGI